MYEWTETYEEPYLKEWIETALQAQKELAECGKILCSTYEQLWLPVVGNLPGVTYQGRERYSAPYGSFEPLFPSPFHGVLAFTPHDGVSVPPALCQPVDWQPAAAQLDIENRSARVVVNDSEITFTSVNVHLPPHELLRELNKELVRSTSGAYLWKIEPILNAPEFGKHLYTDGNVPAMSNAHTRADVTGYALWPDRPHLHTLVYVGLSAHKTSVESLWASLIRGKAGASLRGVSLVADGDIKLVSTPFPDFGVIHAGLVVRKALPGKWEAADDCAYALVFDGNVAVEAELQRLAVKRLQETQAFPIPDEWAKTLWDAALDAGYIQRLETGGDCRGGARLDLTKNWQTLVQGLLEQQLVTV